MTLGQTIEGIYLADEAAGLRLAGWLASRLTAGDCVLLSGDLGAGKTTLARGIIRMLCGMDTEVPSPTFTLLQHYQPGAEPYEIIHADLYRLGGVEETEELGLFEAMDERIVLIEWPEGLAGAWPQNYLRLALAEPESQADAGSGRMLSLGGDAASLQRFQDIGDYMARDAALTEFIAAHNWDDATRRQIAGDASSRRYERLERPEGHERPERHDTKSQKAILMDWPPSASSSTSSTSSSGTADRRDYARQVHLAGTTGAFSAIAGYLRTCGLSAPDCLAQDNAQGFMLLEDFGNDTMTRFIDRHDPRLPIFYHEAVLALVKLHQAGVPEVLPLDGSDTGYPLPLYDAGVMMVEARQFIDWYLPMQNKTLDEAALTDWHKVWADLIEGLAEHQVEEQAEGGQDETPAIPDVLILRDVHSPNLHWLEHLQATARVGFIDVQDAIRGHPAYDVVSLLQDARRDVDPQLAVSCLALYLAESGLPAQRFNAAYAFFGAQRNIRIAGVFARLAMRHNKPRYLQHMPRVLGYIAENLRHPALAPLKDWLAQHVPEVLE